MFEHHFGLRENPFVAGHHAKFVYPSPEHQEALAHLRYGIENREPFVLITGEVGTGKTTALYDALAEWQSRVVVALITNSALNRNELLEEIALRFGVPVTGPATKPQILAHLERSLLAIHQRGDRAILLLDEAQNLERDVLEELRLLSNLEVNGDKLVQLFLVGQPELETKLAKPELRQLRQRITVHYRLRPLNAEDTERYIHHRIGVAGGEAERVFPTVACAEVYRITHGIPREINTVCSQALLNAFVEDAPSVNVQHVASAVGELEFESVIEDEDVPEALRDQVETTRVEEARSAHDELDDEEMELEAEEPAEAPEAPRKPQPVAPEAEHRGPPPLSTRPVPGAVSASAEAGAAEAASGDEPESEFDLGMIDSWMNELKEAKSQEMIRPEGVKARSKPAPAEFARPPKPKPEPPRIEPIEAPEPMEAEMPAEIEPEAEAPMATAPPAAPARQAPKLTSPSQAAPPPPAAPRPIVPDTATYSPLGRSEDLEPIGAAPPSRPQAPVTIEPTRPPEPESTAPETPAPAIEPERRRPSGSMPRPRSLAAEQRAADERAPLPARLRERMEDIERSPSERGPAIAPWMFAVAGVIVILLITLIVRFGPWHGRAAKPAEVASAPSTSAPEASTAAPGNAQPTPAASAPPESPQHIVMTAPEQTQPTKAAVLPPSAPAQKPAAAPKTEVKPHVAPTHTAATEPVIPKEPAQKPSARTYGITVATYLQAARAESQREKFATNTQLPASVNEVVDGGASVYQIVLGKFTTRAAAEKAANDLINRGLIQEAQVVESGKVAKR